jgi:Ca2+-binding RTX toxin-like protein
MALVSVLTSVTGPTGVSLAVGDNLHVAQGVTVSGEVNGIEMLEINQYAMVAGTVLAGNTGIVLGNDANDDLNLNLTLADTSQILSYSHGIVINAAGVTVVNRGTIESIQGAGVQIADAGLFGSGIRNFGTISGENGIVVAMSSGNFSVTNSGTISAKLSGYAVQAFAGASISLTNTGTIDGTVATGAGQDFILTNGNVGQIFVAGGDDSVTIRGAIAGGQIILDAGADTYSGALATGDLQVLGGADRDVFYLGAAAEYIDGGSGVDLVDYNYAKTGQTVVLSTGAAPYAVGSDTFFSIEDVVGSRYGDSFTGSTSRNFLNGQAGADTLSGGGGVDTLEGGLGADVLTGGTGHDSFRYFNNNEGADVITDFSNTATNNDQFVFEVEVFFNPWGGLAQGALLATQFQSRADNRAQDADDRFIFRTTDNTLWFDANGNASGGVRLIADLQAGVVLTEADIFMV